jgi:hypothetical protein
VKWGKFEQRIVLPVEDDVLNVSTRLKLQHGVTINSVEDRYDFMPERHTIENAEQGRLILSGRRTSRAKPTISFPPMASNRRQSYCSKGKSSLRSCRS